jgi:8-oxo-dGTP pyrophosphatase MutT (NUDIX family)
VTLAAQHPPAELLLQNVIGPISSELAELIVLPAKQAAVLVPVVERKEGPVLLLTERSVNLRHHPGQVSFPGGRIEAADHSPTAAALREAEEEIGLMAEEVEVLGSMGRFATGTGFAVTPIVGLVAAGFDAQPDPVEVSAVFEVPLSFLLSRQNLRSQERERFGTRFRMFEYDYQGKRIWGATATMIVTLLDVIDG